MSKKSSTFAPAFQLKPMWFFPRGVNQHSVCDPKSVAQNVALYECIARSRASSSASVGRLDERLSQRSAKPFRAV